VTRAGLRERFCGFKSVTRERARGMTAPDVGSGALLGLFSSKNIRANFAVAVFRMSQPVGQRGHHKSRTFPREAHPREPHRSCSQQWQLLCGSSNTKPLSKSRPCDSEEPMPTAFPLSDLTFSHSRCLAPNVKDEPRPWLARRVRRDDLESGDSLRDS